MPLPEKISRDSSKTTTFRQVTAQFGDSYSQVAPNGINNKIDTWDIVWGGLDTAQYQTVTTAIESVGSWGVLTWTPCNESVQKKFRISGDVKYTHEGTGTFRVEISVKQVFDL